MKPALRIYTLADLSRRFDDEKCVEKFRFRYDELETLEQKLRLPSDIIVQGSKYSKLEGILVALWRGATAA